MALTFIANILNSTASDIQKGIFFQRVVYPRGKSMTPHLLCCQGFAANDYGFTFDAEDLKHPRQAGKPRLLER
jgi:hypothetical protein